MSGRGKSGKGLGKGAAKRHKRSTQQPNTITKPAIKRLARRGGVKRVSKLVYDNANNLLRKYLEDLLQDVVTYAEHAKRKTVSVTDVIYALKRNGTTLVGFHN
ncbi:hypothetical protein EDEG_00845 [Edhazardia aedis USNM 41457]|uniref:Histone H4 n=1 Tax=Edhazardia aedis (strain USNM 41457) TaxID=1003232 RepID=J9DC68_EDHAE|nr:hypothetical protein EDEG_00845 [Edhazardia aedis USNM 41457]|eukprot:EJW05064.1 hypothetical protein EDEG_00845 [Edhazardia aedis USNM 41457]